MDFAYWATWGEVWLNLTLPDIFLPEIQANFNLPDKNQQSHVANIFALEKENHQKQLLKSILVLRNKLFRKLMLFVLIPGVLSHRKPLENQNWKEISRDSFLGFQQPILWGKRLLVLKIWSSFFGIENPNVCQRWNHQKKTMKYV